MRCDVDFLCWLSAFDRCHCPSVACRALRTRDSQLTQGNREKINYQVLVPLRILHTMGFYLFLCEISHVGRLQIANCNNYERLYATSRYALAVTIFRKFLVLLLDHHGASVIRSTAD